MSDAMSRYERQALAEMATTYAGNRFYWRKASVQKLVKRGFAEPCPGYPNAFRLTDAGRAAYEELP
jgi:hypothetical protein